MNLTEEIIKAIESELETMELDQYYKTQNDINLAFAVGFCRGAKWRPKERTDQ